MSDEGTQAAFDDHSQNTLTGTSEAYLANQQQRYDEKRRSELKAAWKQKPLRTFFKRVVMPSAIVGGLSAVFGSYAAEYMPLIAQKSHFDLPLYMYFAAASGAVSRPILNIGEGFLGYHAGRLVGHLKNFRTADMFHQFSRKYKYSGFVGGFLLATLLHAGAMSPVYKDIASDASEATGKAVNYAKEIIELGIAAKNEQNAKPEKQSEPEQLEPAQSAPQP